MGYSVDVLNWCEKVACFKSVDDKKTGGVGVEKKDGICSEGADDNLIDGESIEGLGWACSEGVDDGNMDDNEELGRTIVYTT